MPVLGVMLMETRIETEMQNWKNYNIAHRRYILGRSCIYESTPSEGSFPPRLIVRIFVHENTTEAEGRERKIGEILILADRDRWNNIENLNNVVKADDQLRAAANSAKEGNWDINPLSKLLRKACEVISSKVDKYEADGSPISGEFSI
jgi:hypothetical protein